MTRWKAYSVHVLTAAGIIPAALAMRELTQPEADPVMVFLYLLLATGIDALDGPLARRYHVKVHAAQIDGRTIDDLVDYLTFAFIPLMLIWRMQWLPEGWGGTVTLAMVASLFGFSHCQAKDETGGFFRGFPSYWNIAAFYAGITHVYAGPWAVLLLIGVLTALTVSPVKFLYPNLTPHPWKPWIMAGAAIWVALMLWMLWNYPAVEPHWLWLSLIYPGFYVTVSWLLAYRAGDHQPPDSSYSTEKAQ